jgi:hypothetical protein
MFRKAERKKAKLRLCLCGPGGSGKTKSALLIAKGLGGKVAFIDTEHGSGEFYTDVMEYDVSSLSAPYSTERYISLIKGAEEAGYNVLIIDSLSHAWAGTGGALDMVDKITQSSNSANSFAAWRKVTPAQNALIDAILSSKMHIIATLRTKTAYEIQTDAKGKKVPVKIGQAPIQRDGIEYEFTAVLDMSIDGHIATSSKDRTGLFDGQYTVPTEETGKQLLAWLESGIDPEEQKERIINESIELIKSSPSLDKLEITYRGAYTKLRYQYGQEEKALLTLEAEKNKMKELLATQQGAH